MTQAIAERRQHRMIALLDVAYSATATKGACVVAASWQSPAAVVEVVRNYPPAAPYESGQFFKRELPYLIDMIDQVQHSLQAVVVDGYVWLGAGRPGLGARLFESINGRVPVVGVAKTAFVGAPAISVFRGVSLTPLFVSARGLDATEAAASVASMHGRYRLPTLLKRVDSLSRS